MFVIGTLDIGGAEKQLTELACGLDSSFFDVVVVCLSAGGPLMEKLIRQRIPVHVLGFRGSKIDPPGFVKEFYGLVRLIQREKPDIIHAFLFWAYVVAGFAARVTRAGIFIASRRSLGKFKENQPQLLFLERLVNRWTSLFVANSKAVRNDVCYREGLPFSKVKVVYNGVRCKETESFDDFSDLVQVGFPCVLVLANFYSYKGHSWFLRSWKRVLKSYPAGIVVLAGDGPMRDLLEKQVQESGMENAVRFSGICKAPDRLLQRADFLVQPSSEEGCCNAILEAMSWGKPVIATNVGGNSELVRHETDGLLVPFGCEQTLANAIAKLSSDDQLRIKLGQQARERVSQNFSMDSMIRQYERIYS